MNRYCKSISLRDRPLHILLVSCLVITLSACGFQLRGSSALPEEMAVTYIKSFNPYGSLVVDFADLAFWAPAFGRAKPNSTPLVYPANFPSDWRTDNLRLAVPDATQQEGNRPREGGAPAEPQAASHEPAVLTQEQLAPIVDEARRRVVQSAGPQSAAALDNVSFEIVDLRDDILGRELHGTTIQIDVNAAGQGWFVDATPAENSEFATLLRSDEYRATPTSPASSGVDLLSTVMHELGHILGYHDDDDLALMDATLSLGTRRLPDFDLAFAEEESAPDDSAESNTRDATAIDNAFAAFGER